MEAKFLRNVLYGMAMLSMASCMEEELVNEVPLEAEFEADIEAPSSAISAFVEDTDEETRTYIYEGDVIGTKWRAKESIGVYGSYSKNVKFTSTNTSDASSVKFSGLMLGTPKYCYYPYSTNNNGVSQTAVKGTMPAVHPYNSSYKDIVGDYRAGTLDSRSWFSSTFTFTRLVSIVRLLVDASGTALEGDNISSIAIKVNNQRKVSGDFTINLQTQAITLGAFKEGNDSLTLQWEDEPALMNGNIYTAYMTCLPNIQSGDELTFTIRTKKHIATFKRTSKVNYTANTLYKYTLTLKDVDMTVTDIEHTTVQQADTRLKSMKFTAADNPGKILSRSFTHNSSGTVTVDYEADEKAAVCTIDTVNFKVTLNLPYLNNRKLIPTFELGENAHLWTEDDMEIISGETEVDFTTVKRLKVVNNIGAGIFYDVELTNTGLPVVVINQLSKTVKSESGEYASASTAWYEATGTEWQPKDSDWSMEEGDNFMIYNADGTSALTDKSGNVVEEPILASTRVRGNVSQQMPKKPFAVKLDKKHGVLDMPAHKRWVLLANWKDRTLMRNEVAFGLAEVFQNTFSDGLAWNPSGQHVELVYNGVHVGNYYLCEQIKIDDNRLKINEPLDEEDNPYTGEPKIFGYLLESDDGYDEATKFVTKNHIPFLFKDDADANGKMLEYVKGIVQGIEDNLYKGYKGTSTSFDEAYKTMDLASFVDYWLIQELMMNSEMQHPKSVYSYINDGILYAGPVWDFDWNTLPTSGSSECSYSYNKSMLEHAVQKKILWTTTYYCFHASEEPNGVKEDDRSYMWYPMLVKSTTFQDMAAERWNQVKGALQAYVGTIQATAKAIKASETVNNAMWPIDSKNNAWRSKEYGIGGDIYISGVTNCGYCGDEAMTFDNAISNLTKLLTDRIEGMNYVSNKSWPSITYDEE